MSTTDGNWLDRDLDINYCRDNIRRPVLFGTAIDKIISDEGPDGVRFMEIAPHPVLKVYLEQCGGEPITLICRPNPKVPAPKAGDYYQLLEGIGNLLSTGFKNVDFDKLCTAPDGTTDFMKAMLPNYPYSKSRCWMESGWQQFQRLREWPCPIASPHFPVCVDTPLDLTGHIVFDAVLFPTSGCVIPPLFDCYLHSSFWCSYVESILDNGAIIVTNIAIHNLKALVLNGVKWEFRTVSRNAVSPCSSI